MIAILILVNLALFWKTLKYGHANDDFEVARCGCKEPQIKEIPGPRGIKRICAKCHFLEGDKPKNIIQNVWWHLFKQYTNPKLAHSLVMIIHNLNCILIYLAFGSNKVSFLAALLFAIHPVATQGSSVWLSGKPYSLSLMLTLCMFWLKPFAPIFYFFALSLGAQAITAPMAFIKSPWWPMMLIIPITILIRRKLVFSYGKTKYAGIAAFRKPIIWSNIILMFKTIGYYFMLCLYPTSLGVHHPYLETYGLTKEETKHWLQLDRFFALGVVLAYIVAINFFWNYNQAVFGLFWFFIFILPWSNIITIHMFISERYAVIALVGYCWMLSNLLLAIPDKAIQYAACAVFLTYYVARTRFYLPLYKSVLETAQWNVMNFPRSFAGWAWKGGIENNLGLQERAFESWLNAWQLRPNDFRINNNLTTYLVSRGEFAEAKKFYNMAVTSPVPKHKEEDKARQLANLKSEIMSKEAIIKRGITQVSRNEPCVCGSGRKYRNCCGKENVWTRT